MDLIKNVSNFFNTHKLLNFFSSPFFPVLFFSCVILGYKLYFLELTARAVFDCQWCFNTAIIHEVQFLFFIILLYTLSLSRYLLVSIFFKVIILLCILIAAIDTILLNQFLIRFTFHEFLKFSGEYLSIIDFIKQLISTPIHFIVITLFVIFITYITTRFLKTSIVKSTIGYSFILVFLIISLHFLKPVEYHTPYMLNAIEAFIKPQSRTTPYSQPFIQSIPKNTDQKLCFNGEGARPNIVLVIIESLSMYHSEAFSNLNNWTPNLDSISNTDKKFINFYANGINTEDGLVALFTGLPPIPKGGDSKTIFDQYQNTDSLPKILNKINYQTLFLTTGDLNFLNKGKWLSNIGFNYIEGSEADFYKGMERFHFNAAADKALYDRSYEKITQIASNPFFMAIETVSTHHPFVDPETKIHSEQQAFKYADKQLSHFINNLKKIHFFDNGYLIVSSDHRAMVPLRKKERSLYGNEAYARIPFLTLGKSKKIEVTESFSQIDLLPSLQHWLGSDQYCINRNQGIFLPSVIHKPDCIYSRRSYSPDNIYIQCGDAEYEVKLDADNTGFIGDKEGPMGLISQVNRLRLNLGY